MIWVVLALLAVAALAPLALTLRRGRAARGRREAALALHRAQLAELDRDLAENRIGAAEHASATLEVQRRLLAAAGTEDATPERAARLPVLLALGLVPAAAFGLYLVGGAPGVPSVPFAERKAQQRDEDALIAQLRNRLMLMDPHGDQTRQGYLLLGHAEEGRDHWDAAAAAYQQALAIRFDATLAARTAEALSRGAQRVTPEAVALFRQALAAAGKDAPWRDLAEQRIKEAEASAPQ